MAKHLYLVRHAKSSWTDMSLSDFDRPLNTRGLRDAPEMGRRLKVKGISPDTIVCSPARRTRQTLELILAELGGTMDAVLFDENIYEASAEALLQILQSLPDDCSSAMLVGHNPSIGWLAQELSDSRIDRMPTCAIAAIELETGRWNEISTCAARLIDFDYPKKAR